VDYIERFGLLGPKMTLGHGVWLSEGDLDKLAATGTHICHNCSSNFRLPSGVAPLNRFEATGINTAMSRRPSATSPHSRSAATTRRRPSVRRRPRPGCWRRTGSLPGMALGLDRFIPG
jgi:hypothetical protein